MKTLRGTTRNILSVVMTLSQTSPTVSIQRIAEECGYGNRTVRRHIAALREIGVVDARRGYKGVSYTYSVNSTQAASLLRRQPAYEQQLSSISSMGADT